MVLLEVESERDDSSASFDDDEGGGVCRLSPRVLEANMVLCGTGGVADWCFPCKEAAFISLFSPNEQVTPGSRLFLLTGLFQIVFTQI